MSLPYQPPNVISDDQRERAVNHLQAQYANGTIGEAELDRRLDLALNAHDRVQLNRSLLGLARIAPAMLRPTAPGHRPGAVKVARISCSAAALSEPASPMWETASMVCAAPPASRVTAVNRIAGVLQE